MSEKPSLTKIDLAVQALSRVRPNVALERGGEAVVEVPVSTIENLYRLALAVEFTSTHLRRRIEELVEEAGG